MGSEPSSTDVKAQLYLDVHGIVVVCRRRSESVLIERTPAWFALAARHIVDEHGFPSVPGPIPGSPVRHKYRQPSQVAKVQAMVR